MDENAGQNPAGILRNTLNFQFRISCQLLDFHLEGLTDEEYHWRPAARGLHISNRSGEWRADWPESEAYEIGPPSIAWLTWHITFWWSMVLDYTFGNGSLAREDVGSGGCFLDMKERITNLREKWEAAIAELPDEELLSSERTRWPFTDRPLHELAAWLNLELMKNAAEIGYCRFLYGARK